jgi:hypothetical protein
MRAWLGLVKGEEPPSMIGVYDDVLASEKPYSDYSAEEVVRKGKMRVRRRMEYPLVLLGFLPELILRPKEDSYTLFFPQSLAHALRERHTKTLTDKYGSDPGITNSDIVSSALLKVCFPDCKVRGFQWVLIGLALSTAQKVPSDNIILAVCKL